MNEPVTTRFDSPKAPDWGVNYGIDSLWSEIAPGLWMGGTDDHDTVAHARASTLRRGDLVPQDHDVAITKNHFDAVVTMYAWARPVDWFVEELRYSIMDSENGIEDVEKLRETVVWAHKRWANGDKVLVRCQAGLNRSGLVTALMLIRDGLDPAEAIQVVRAGRSDQCLFNKGFVRFITSVHPEFWRD